MRNIIEAYDDMIGIINDRLVEAVPLAEPSSLYKAVGHLLKAGGKKVRPLLTLVCCEAVGGNAIDSLDIAVAIELLHVASLIHDDILDGDTLRRGMRTVHSIWGTETAIVAGDLLIGKAIEIATHTEYPGVLNLMALATIEMCEGEILERELQKNIELISEEICLEIVKKKTASLIRVAAESGAIVGGGSEKMVESISRYGELVGMAFQVRDDVLNFISDESIIKKPSRTDLTAMRPNLVLLNHANSKLDCRIKDVQETAESFSDRAKLEIRELELQRKSKNALEELADFASKRLF